MTPVYDAYTATLINVVDLPHMYDEKARPGFGRGGYNGAPEQIKMVLPRPMSFAGDIPPAEYTALSSVAIYLFRVPINMPGIGERTYEMAVTFDRESVEKLPTSRNHAPVKRL